MSKRYQYNNSNNNNAENNNNNVFLHYLNEELENKHPAQQQATWFQTGHVLWHKLCASYNDLARIKEVRKPTHAVVLDFKKAFDNKVPHKLMEKIGKLQLLHPQIVDWIHDFLCNRKQRVVLCGQSSSEKSVTSGVPQGFYTVFDLHQWPTWCAYLWMQPICRRQPSLSGGNNCRTRSWVPTKH